MLGWYEYYERRLPNVLTLGGAAAFLLLHYATGGRHGLVNSLIGGVIGFLFLLIPFLKNGAGAGDVKMLTAVGILFGFPSILHALTLCSIFGLLMGVWMFLIKRVGFARIRHWLNCCFRPHYDREEGRKSLPPKNTESLRLPFGIAISLGTWLTIVYFLLHSSPASS